MDGARLDELLVESRAAWPGIALDAGTFARWVESRCDGSERAHAADLYLACACAQGLPSALAAFDRVFLAQVPAFLARIDRSHAFADEVCQQLREKLFVGTAPRIAEYSGRGPLAAWLRVIAVRQALAGRRRKLDQQIVDEPEAPEVLCADDPELELVRARYQPEFTAALREALDALAPRDRVLLRLHFVEGLSVDRIGERYRVHRATAARWVAAARDRVLDGTRQRLGERLGVDSAEFRSLTALLRSRLAFSLVRHLGAGASAG